MGSLDEEARAVLEKVPIAPEGDRGGNRPSAAEDDSSRPAGSRAGSGGEAVRVEAPGGEGEGLATVTLAELHAAQGLHAEAVRIYERLLERRPGDPRLARGLERARRLRDGEAREGREAAPEREAAGSVRTGPADGPWREGADERRNAGESRPHTPAGLPGMTIREYLTRLLEGRAPSTRSPDPPSGGSSRLDAGEDAGAEIASATGIG